MVAELIVIEQPEERPVLPTVEHLLALVEQADLAAAEAATYITPTYAHRALYWAMEAEHERQRAQREAARAANPELDEYWAERAATWTRTAARGAAYAAKRARYWTEHYARQLERAAR